MDPSAALNKVNECFGLTKEQVKTLSLEEKKTTLESQLNNIKKTLTYLKNSKTPKTTKSSKLIPIPSITKENANTKFLRN